MQIFNHMEDRRATLRKQAQQWLLRLTSGAATTSDAQAFEYWCGQSRAHREAFAETRLLWENLGPAATAWTMHERERVTQLRESTITPLFSDTRRMTRRAFLGGAVAASAACIVLRPPLKLWPSLFDLTSDYRTGTGEQRQVEIAPGIVIEMNTQTTMNVRKLQGRPIGIDLLNGELQIKTAATADSPFAVSAAGGSLLMGAQAKCNVRCLGSSAQITGLDGVSFLKYQGRSAVVRTAQRVDYGSGKLGSAVSADTELTMAWRRRILIFDGQPLSEVVEEINRYRPGRIILANDRLAVRKVQARFSLNQLADVASLIKDAYGAKITSLPDGIVVLS